MSEEKTHEHNWYIDGFYEGEDPDDKIDAVAVYRCDNQNCVEMKHRRFYLIDW